MSFGAYVTHIKKYLAGETFSAFNNLKLINWEQFNFPYLKKENKWFNEQQEVQKAFFKEHRVYYGYYFSKVKFVEINPTFLIKKDTNFIVCFIKNLIALNKAVSFDTSNFRTNGFYSLLNGEKKSWANWSYFSYSDLQQNKSIESHIYKLINKNKLAVNRIHLNSNDNNIYYYWNYPYMPYLEVASSLDNNGSGIYYDAPRAIFIKFSK